MTHVTKLREGLRVCTFWLFWHDLLSVSYRAGEAVRSTNPSPCIGSGIFNLV